MCGISGILNCNRAKAEVSIKKMISAQSHRGPDGNKYFQDDKITFGHNRLSIVDIEGGDQPMHNSRNTAVITFNGEIYGFEKLKKEYDYNYSNKSDTELVLAMYDNLGEKFIQKLPGMFSFAIWDSVKNSLFCARDRFGEKPFYYAIGDNDEFIFASELKTILASELITPKLDREMIGFYLLNGYIHAHKSVFSNIHVLPPAHTLIFDKSGLKIFRYWNIPERLSSEPELKESLGEFQFLFTEAVRNQLVADVPVGAFLSGGLDSSSVLSEAVKINPSITTYSFDFKYELGESKYASEVSAFFGVPHVILKETAGNNLSDLIVKANSVYDEPFSDSSMVPTFLICQLAGKYGKVALTGDGADELLGGYGSWYDPLVSYSGFNPSQSKYIYLLKAISELIQSKFSNNISREHRNNRLLYDAKSRNLDLLGYYLQLRNRNKKFLIDSGFEIFSDPEASFTIENSVCDALNYDLTNYLPGDILVKTDRASMANGIELRSPFLDINLAEFILRMPASMKISSGGNKILLRELKKNALPQSILSRKKQGFGASIDIWKKDKGVQELRNEYVNNPSKLIYNYISYKNTRELISKKDGFFWDVLQLSLWFENNKKWLKF